MRFAEVTLSAPLDLRDFYAGALGLPADGNAIVIGETRLRFDVEEGGAFYHLALLVPGGRFAAGSNGRRDGWSCSATCSSSRTGTRRPSTSTIRPGASSS